MTKEQLDQTEHMLIKYRPNKQGDSQLLNDLQISNLCGHIGSLYQNLRWKLLYRLNEHGTSMNTFLEKLSCQDTTLVIIEDKHGWKFGGFCHEEWTVSKQFYGTGENFVFTFKAGDDIDVSYATGENFMFQYCDRQIFGLGGGVVGGRFACYLGHDFLRGSSAKTECFNNEQLSKKAEFMCVDMEVWGFE